MRLSDQFQAKVRGQLDDTLLTELGAIDTLKKRLITRLAQLDTKEEQAAKGKWKGGKRPFGYQVDKTTHILIVDENTVTDTHDAIIHTKVWEQAQAILDAWGESHAHCAASGSDYVLTGRLRCPRCGKAMIGTRATGRNKTYQLLHVLEPRPLRRQQMRLQTPQRR